MVEIEMLMWTKTTMRMAKINANFLLMISVIKCKMFHHAVLQYRINTTRRMRKFRCFNTSFCLNENFNATDSSYGFIWLFGHPCGQEMPISPVTKPVPLA